MPLPRALVDDLALPIENRAGAGTNGFGAGALGDELARLPGDELARRAADDEDALLAEVVDRRVPPATPGMIISRNPNISPLAAPPYHQCEALPALSTAVAASRHRVNHQYLPSSLGDFTRSPSVSRLWLL